MIRDSFLESPEFASMSEQQQKATYRILKKVANFENSTGQMLENGLSREQYVELLNSIGIRRTFGLSNVKSYLYKYVKYLISEGILAPEQLDILKSISINDIGSVHYYKNVQVLYEAVKDTIQISECYDSGVFDIPAVAIFLSWYGLTKEEIVNYRKENVHSDGIIVNGEKIIPPPDVLRFFTNLRNSGGYFQKLKGVVFIEYALSEYLIRTRFKDHLDPVDVANIVARMNKKMDGKYFLEMGIIRKSGIFFRAYQLECNNAKFDVNDPVFASKVFCEDFTGDGKKYKVAHMSCIRDYKRYKRLFSID